MSQATQEKRTVTGVTDEVASLTWTVDLPGHRQAHLAAGLGVYHLTSSGYCSRLEWVRETLALAGLDHIELEATAQTEYDALYRKPVFSALTNRTAAKLSIDLRPWQEAMGDYFDEIRLIASPASRQVRARV